MKKRTIFSLIIIVGFLAQFILANFVFRNFPPVISFILLVPFYLLTYLYYRRYKLITVICFISIFTLMANLFMLGYLGEFALYSNKIRLIGMVSFFGCLINNLLAFILILQVEPRSKFLKGLVVFIVLVNYFFFSYYLFPLTNILASIFGPNQVVIDNMLVILQIFLYVLQAFIVISQVIIIFKFDFEEEYYLKSKTLS